MSYVYYEEYSLRILWNHHWWSNRKDLLREFLFDDSKQSSFNYFTAAALANNHDGLLFKFIRRNNKKISNPIEVLVTSYREDISSLFAFIKRNMRKSPDSGLKELIGREGDGRFYLIPMKTLMGKSLLEYIVDNGPRMLTQRDELLDLLVEQIRIKSEVWFMRY